MNSLVKTLFAAALSLAALSSCKDDRSIIVEAQDGSQVRLEVVTEDIIRVSAVPKGAKFSTKPSLMVVPHRSETAFKVEEKGGLTLVSTSKVVASVDNASGAVSFYNALTGSAIVSESAREFKPIEVEGDKAWTVRQLFNSSDNEGFYGLGQHQADEWNYKGRNEELYQYNTKISVPFVVSSKKYGILWDSYSFCRWGDPRDYSMLSDVFKLYDKYGVEGALTGTYTPASGQTLVRRELNLAQEFLDSPDCEVVRNAPAGFEFSGSHVVFEGSLEPQESGLFHFYLYYAGYTKLYIDGEMVMPEIWRTAWNPNGRKFALNMEKGKRAAIRMEWEPDGGVSYNSLRVLSPVAPELQAKMSWWGEMQRQIDYYFIAGDSIDEVISGYRTLTGKAQIMPKWAMGYWQSRERFKSQDELVSTLQEFRERKVPVDNIVQDWQYWEDDQWGSHEFDPRRYPDPEKMLEDVHSLNGRFMISVWPKFYTGTEHFKQLDSKGWIYKWAVVDSVQDWLGYQQSFYDAYAEGARKMFWDQMYNTLPKGVDAWWMDASEPNVRDCVDMDYRKALCGPTALGTSTEYFNAYALVNAMAIYDGQRSVEPDRRVFLLTRNGFAGLQRYSTASWSGDIGTRWEEMKAQISAGLNYSISGIPFWGQDIGGFSVENRYSKAQNIFDETGVANEDMIEWRELNARWHQWGVYCPLYRAHGQFPYREPWNISPEGTPAYEAILKADQTRYILMPYIYTMAARVHFEDYTIMRALVMSFDDPKVLNISDEYMFGDAILVCPVYEYGARSRQVYLPAGEKWYDAHSLKLIEGGQTITAPAPFERIPLYYRAGQIIPTGDLVQSTAETQSTITLNIYSGKNASYSLYEDDGLSYNYEKGQYSWIPITWDEASRTLSIEERQGSFEGMLDSRDVVVKLYSDCGVITKTVKYDGSQVSVNF